MKLFIYIGRIAPFLLAIFVPVFIALVLFNLWFLKPAVPGSMELYSVEVKNGDGIKEVAESLSLSGLVRSSFAARILLGRIEKKQGKTLDVPEGEYEISPALSPSQVINRLVEGRTIQRKFRINEGDTYQDIAASIEASGLFSKETMLQVMKKRDLLIKLRLSAGIPEGYFLPGEFTFSKPITPEKIFETLIRKSQVDFDESFPNILGRIEKLYLDFYQLLTLSSIIEKEGGSQEIKKLVSSVYHNRLILQMPLETDITLAYYLDKKVSDVSPKDRIADGPYNTFKRVGLPVTPICTPGKESISSALFPARSEYLYFLPQPRTSEDFSLTLEEHLEKLKKRT